MTNDIFSEWTIPPSYQDPARESCDPRSVRSLIHCHICNAPTKSDTKHNLSSCNFCGHVFQSDLSISVSYDAQYAHQYDALPVSEMSRIRWAFIQAHLNLPHGSRILDVGYGNGAFLRHARDSGMDIYGIDLHSEDFGVPVVDFDTTLDYDLVCFFDSLEHFPSFDSIFKLSTRNVVISIPHTPEDLLAEPTTWRHYKPGEHLHYFSPNSLSLLMARWGIPNRLAAGFPEDTLRGKITRSGQTVDNIYTAIYTAA